MSDHDISFYVTGGTLRQDALSYVERRADHELLEALGRGEFSYVLTSRQMGKSSLMVRTAAKLREEGAIVAILDLTAVGQNLTAEQWYEGLLSTVGQQLGLEDELDAFWLAHPTLGPLQRFMRALREVVLPSVAADGRRTTDDGNRETGDPPSAVRGRSSVVLFIDEIDVVRNLPFSTDEFFAAIRECYNRRTEDPAFRQLTFCLLGVATPSDLIRDTRTTPFNIGRRIDLSDFTEAEAAPLAIGLEVGELATGGRPEKEARALLKRILYWTSGHPYLTQRLSQAVAGEPGVHDAVGVDHMCAALFLSPRAQERDDNLLFVRERLLRSEADLAALLDRYRRVCTGKRVPDDDTDPLCGVLRLSGVTQVRDGWLEVRNRIYACVFNPAWVTAHMPGAELRRQQAAFRRGLQRATAISAVVVSVMAGLALNAISSARRARLNARAAGLATRREQERTRDANRYRYVADMNLTQQAIDEGDLGRSRALLEAHRPPKGGDEDLRGFEWHYLWRRTRSDDLFTLNGSQRTVLSVAYSPNGTILATGGSDSTVRFWDLGTRRETAVLRGQSGRVAAVTFSPDGKMLATGSTDGSVWLWDAQTKAVIATVRPPGLEVDSLAFSPDGGRLAASGDGGTVSLWDVAGPRGRRHPRQVGRLRGPPGTVDAVAWSPDGRIIVTGGTEEQRVKLWDARTCREISVLPGQHGQVRGCAFSPDGRILATASSDMIICLWDVIRRQLLATLRGHTGVVCGVAFSPDGKRLASTGDDHTIRIWSLARGPRSARAIAVLNGHTAQVLAIAFSKDGKTIATGAADGTARIWPSGAQPEPVDLLRGFGEGAVALSFSPDGRLLAIGTGDGMLQLWDPGADGNRPRRLAAFREQSGGLNFVVFSPDGKQLVTGGLDGVLRLRSVGSRRTPTALGRPGRWLACAAFSPDGRLLASGGEGGMVSLWNLSAGTCVTTLPADPEAVHSVAFSPDGRILATGGMKQVRLWEVGRSLTAPRELGRLEGSAYGEVFALAFSRDGRVLATAARDHIVRLWDVSVSGRPHELLPALEGHKNEVFAVCFLPGGNRLATASADMSCRMWDLSTRQEVARFKGHTDWVMAVAVSPDGNILASAGSDAAVRLWRAAGSAETERF